MGANFRLLVCDIDGTLMNNHGYISPETKRSLHELKRRGIGMTLATGRNEWEARDIVQRLDVTLPVILSDGAQIFDFSTGELLYAEVMDGDVVRRFLSENVPSSADVRWYDGTTWNTLPFVQFLSQYDRSPIKRLMIHSPAEVPLKDSDHFPFWVFHDGRDRYELTPKTAEKGKALIVLCQQLSIAPEQTVSLGNDTNDISLFRSAAVGLAMGDSKPAVKEHADCVVGPFSENPVVNIVRWLTGELTLERIVAEP